MSTQTATAEKTQEQPQSRALRPIDQVRNQITKMRPEFSKALPSHVSVDKFERVVMTAINQQPDLLDCTRQSLFGACVRAAQDGLLPDGREGAIVSFNDRKAGVKLAQWMPMVAGVLKKIRNSGELSTISAHVVCRHDDFDYELGDQERIMHKPLLTGDRGDIIAAYAIAHLKDGAIMREVMSIGEIEEVRKVSRSADNKYGPWANWYGEMARKTVIRRLSKRLPMSTDLERVVQRDDDLYEVGSAAQNVLDHSADSAPKPASVGKLDAFAGKGPQEPEAEGEGPPQEDAEIDAAVGEAETDPEPAEEPKQQAKGKKSGGGKKAEAEEAAGEDSDLLQDQQQTDDKPEEAKAYALIDMEANRTEIADAETYEGELTKHLQTAPNSDDAQAIWDANKEEVMRMQQDGHQSAASRLFGVYNATQPGEE